MDSSETGVGCVGYASAVHRLVDAQAELLFSMVTAAVERASSGSRPSAMTRAGRSLTVSAGERVVVVQIEALTDQPEDLRLAVHEGQGQARGTLSMPDGAAEEWVLVLQRVGAGDAVSQHRWMHAGTARAVDEESTAGTLRALFA